MAKLGFKLTWLLIIRALARPTASIAVIWGIVDWYFVHPAAAVVFGLLTFNFVVVHIFGWVAPSQINGPLRIRPFQTFVMLGNVIILPIVFHRTYGYVPWGFVAAGVLFIVGLFVSTWIYVYLNEKLPMGQLFADQRLAKARDGGYSPLPVSSDPSR